MNARDPDVGQGDLCIVVVGESYKAWQASLPSLETLDAATARALADLDRELKLSGGTILQPAAARGLTDFKGPMLTVDFSGRGRRLTVEHAAAVAEFRGRHLTISGLRKLPADVARALARFRGHDLSLLGPPWRRVAAAQELAAFTGDTLALLDGNPVPQPFERLILLPTNATLAALAGFRGRHLLLEPGVYEQIGGRVPLTVAVARLVALQPLSSEGEVGTPSLDAITAIDGRDAVEIARILATVPGMLVLPNLKKISPKALVVLLEKEDVSLPLIETLELIPEPDGSPNDDVGIPQKFLDRQKQR